MFRGKEARRFRWLDRPTPPSLPTRALCLAATVTARSAFVVAECQLVSIRRLNLTS